jgi:hypothetical protein
VCASHRDQRHLDHHQIEFFAEVVFDVAAQRVNRLLRFAAVQQRTVIRGKYSF